MIGLSEGIGWSLLLAIASATAVLAGALWVVAGQLRSRRSGAHGGDEPALAVWVDEPVVPTHIPLWWVPAAGASEYAGAPCAWAVACGPAAAGSALAAGTTAGAPDARAPMACLTEARPVRPVAAFRRSGGGGRSAGHRELPPHAAGPAP